MIVVKYWPSEDEVEGFFIAEGPGPRTDSHTLEHFREVPASLWEIYVAAQKLVAGLTAKIEACPQLPIYVEFAERQAREYEKRAKIEREIGVMTARDRAMQEEIRRAGQLTPLLKDCPTDEPVRIG